MWACRAGHRASGSPPPRSGSTAWPLSTRAGASSRSWPSSADSYPHGAGSDLTTGPDQEAFVTVGDLLRASVAPPDVSAALFRAAARIPGVIVVSDVVDAAGRHGVAVAREHDGERFEWIFDMETKELLGERTVLVKGNAWGKAGTPVTSTAVTRSGIVDKTGQTPARSSGQGEDGLGPRGADRPVHRGPEGACGAVDFVGGGVAADAEADGARGLPRGAGGRQHRRRRGAAAAARVDHCLLAGGRGATPARTGAHRGSAG
ncbi:CU044_5270 family protein [Streptomyces flaveus]|uniref:CU044_5270 family protein n=1 Tax=Streptomyces flaveus TaxID=66370 RepID=UPI0033335B56